MSADLFIAAKRSQDLLNELLANRIIDSEHEQYSEVMATLTDLNDAIEAVGKKG